MIALIRYERRRETGLCGRLSAREGGVMLMGVVGLGEMGSGIARNLLKAGFKTYGYDLRSDRTSAFVEAGGRACHDLSEIAPHVDAVFVMVLNGDQVKSVLFGPSGIAAGLRKGATIILTATIKPAEAREIASRLHEIGLRIIDIPVSGGYAGAQSGSLTMMAAGPADLIAEHQSILDAVGSKIFTVGDKAGDGQTVKACLQALIGGVFTATFESAVLAAKSGIPGQVIYDVFSASAAGSKISNNALEKIIDRRFVGTGSHIGTMYKDLTISLDHARDLGVPMFTAAAAMQLFQAGITKFPGEDNWAVIKVLEDIVGITVSR
jgi:3-hydroxyisobutyrate dehydrogenase-like beta-hydroxyacid dehydrogenase